jgi:hypothetical protein
MTISTDTKKIMIGAVVAAGLFYLVVYVFEKKKGEPEGPKQIPITDENIDVAAEAYRMALQNGEDAATLDELNKSFLTEYGITIRQRDDGKLLVRNMAGNNIKAV